MFKDKYVAAILPAAGVGKRMGAASNKIWLEIEGKTILERTLTTFRQSALVDRIVIVVNAAEMDSFNRFLATVEDDGFQTPIVLTAGGAERQDSVRNGLQFLTGISGINGEQSLVVIHDAARALLTVEQLEQTIAAAWEYRAAGIGVPVKDTIKEVDRDGWIVRTPERSTLWAIQTPQVFDLDLLVQCYHRMRDSGLVFTDDCGVVESCGYPVKMVMGSYENFKITTPEDLTVAGTILRRREDAGGTRI